MQVCRMLRLHRVSRCVSSLNYGLQICAQDARVAVSAHKYSTDCIGKREPCETSGCVRHLCPSESQ